MASPKIKLIISNGYMVYCNRPNRRIKIHRDTCRHIEAQQNIHGDINGEWIGPFNEYGAALRIARGKEQQYRAVASNCGHCLRNHK